MLNEQLEILRLSHDGRGVARDHAGKTVFVAGALPGEQVTFQINAKSRRFYEATAQDILNPSSERVSAACPHFLLCGGCAQQHISHAAQLAAKQQTLLEQLEHFAKLTPKQVLAPITGPIWGYRTKARLGVRYVIKKDQVLVGFREKQSRYLAAIDSCAVLPARIGNMIPTLKSLIRSLDAYKSIAQIEVAVGEARFALIFRHLEALTEHDQQALLALAQQQDFDLYLQAAGPDSIIKIWPADQNLRLYYTLPNYALNLAFHPTDFTQVNLEVNRQMIDQAIDLLQLQSQDRVLDLFCGLGNFTLAMARKAAHVIGIEGSTAMVERGYENAQRNNISNVEFYAADLTIDQSTATWAKPQYQKILIDPPRSGALELLPLIAKLQAPMLLYVSCNPATLARDCGVLTKEYGYSLQAAGIVDMFPHTMHVESMALLVR